MYTNSSFSAFEQPGFSWNGQSGGHSLDDGCGPVLLFVVVDCFYIVLFSTLVWTCCTHVSFYISD